MLILFVQHTNSFITLSLIDTSAMAAEDFYICLEILRCRVLLRLIHCGCELSQSIQQFRYLSFCFHKNLAYIKFCKASTLIFEVFKNK